MTLYRVLKSLVLKTASTSLTSAFSKIYRGTKVHRLHLHWRHKSLQLLWLTNLSPIFSVNLIRGKCGFNGCSMLFGVCILCKEARKLSDTEKFGSELGGQSSVFLRADMRITSNEVKRTLSASPFGTAYITDLNPIRYKLQAN